jgi:hypothetical protein
MSMWNCREGEEGDPGYAWARKHAPFPGSGARESMLLPPDCLDRGSAFDEPQTREPVGETPPRSSPPGRSPYSDHFQMSTYWDSPGWQGRELRKMGFARRHGTGLTGGPWTTAGTRPAQLS